MQTRNGLSLVADYPGRAPADGACYLITIIDDGVNLSFYVNRRLAWTTVPGSAYVEGGKLVIGGDAQVLMEFADGKLGRLLAFRGAALTYAQAIQNYWHLRSIYPLP